MNPYNRRPPESADFTFFSPISGHLEYNAWAQNLKTLNNSFNKPKLGPWARAEGSSPPLWKPSCSNSRSQMIHKYRQEMMEFVRELPETAYELSLRDMVDLKEVERREEGKEEALLKGSGKRRARSARRSRSMDFGGFYLKMFVPSVLSGVGSGRRVSAPIAVGGDGEWIGGRSSSSGSNGSSDSACSGSRRKRWYVFCF